LDRRLTTVFIFRVFGAAKDSEMKFAKKAPTAQLQKFQCLPLGIPTVLHLTQIKVGGALVMKRSARSQELIFS
jgi:hypothetical protein